jgi:CheY-like chemotaxis protein
MDKKRILIVEDDPRRCDWFKQQFIGCQIDITCNVQEAIELLKIHNYSEIMLDHDLADIHYTSPEIKDDEHSGYGVVKWLANTGAQKNAKIIVHSLNPTGSLRMFLKLQDSGHNVQKVPYHILRERMKFY